MWFVWCIIFCPLLSALLGYFIARIATNIYLFRVLPKRQAEIGAALGKIVSEHFSFSAIEEKLTDEKSIEKIMPEAENQVDNFLRNKLKTAFPIIGSFIGDKTINQLKDIFIKELREILPSLLKRYISNLEKDMDLEKMVSNQIASIPRERTVIIINKLSTNLKGIYALGALIGFLVGVFELFMVYAIIHWIIFVDKLPTDL